MHAAETTQAELYKEITNLVDTVCDGQNVCIFAYGQTGAGKTHTLIGGDDDQEGILPRSMK